MNAITKKTNDLYRLNQPIDRRSALRTQLRDVSPPPIEIKSIDTTYRNVTGKIHLMYIAAIFLTGFVAFQAAKHTAPPAPLATERVIERFTMQVGPVTINPHRRNTYDRQYEINEITAKYEKEESALDNAYRADRQAQTRATDNYTSTSDYFDKKKAYKNAVLDIAGRRDIELCERTKFACREAEDFRQSTRRQLAGVSQ